MSSFHAFKPTLFTVMIRATTALPLVIIGNSAVAQTNVEGRTDIQFGTPLDNYRVLSGATLNATGANLLYVDAEAGAHVLLNDSDVTPGSSAVALALTGANATLERSTVTASSRALTGSQGASISANDSVIRGGSRGASLNQSHLELRRSEVHASDNNGVAVELFDGSVSASDSSLISGGRDGILVRDGSGQTDAKATIVLDNSRVEGLDGSAIAVGRGAGRAASAQIDVLNGSTLSASNGVLVNVADAATASLRVSDSQLLGDIVVAEGGTANVMLENAATLTGRLENVAQVAIDSGAEWAMVGNAAVEQLTMNGGRVSFGNIGEFHTLTLGSLSGNGTFVMDADFASGQHDFLDITGNATGDHSLLVRSSGTDLQADASLHMVHADSGDARFSLEGGPVDVGTYSYDLVPKGSGNDWYLDKSTRTISPGTQSVLALFNTAPTIWYGEMSTLRGRMGEVRRDAGQAGSWVRTFGNKYNVAGAEGLAYQQTQQGLSFGADAPLPIGDGNWLAGITAGYSQSDLSLARGTQAKVDSYHLGVYSTWLEPESGYYIDAVARLNQFKNQSDVRLSDGTKTKGSYDNLGVGAALEIGRHISLDEGWFVEPHAQLAGLIVQGKDYTLDNGMRAEGGRTHSLQTKLGATVGRKLEVGDGRMIQPYVRVAAVHEFANDNHVKVNGNGFNNDLSGSRGEVGTGIAVAWADKWRAHADFEYAHGSKLEQPWGVNLGVRYNW